MLGIGYKYEPSKEKLMSLDKHFAPKFVQLPSGKVSYQLGGNDDGELVVLIPGLTIPMEMWNPTYEFLKAQGYRVLCYDLYGRGGSDCPNVDYSYPFLVNQLEDLLESLALDKKFYLYGSSLGAGIATEYSIKNPNKIKKLILEGAVGLGKKLPFQQRLLISPIFGDLIFRTLLPVVLDKHLLENFLDPKSSTPLRKLALKQTKNPSFNKTLLSTIRNSASLNIESSYAELAKKEFPKLIIWGAEDKITPTEHLQRLLKILGKVDYQIIEKAGHLPHLEKDEEHNKLLLKFLKC